jgi:hypothetical protein
MAREHGYALHLLDGPATEMKLEFTTSSHTNRYRPHRRHAPRRHRIANQLKEHPCRN